AQARPLAGNTMAVLGVAYSANGQQAAAGGADKSLTVWNVADGKELKKIPNLPAAVTSVAFNADAKFVAAGLGDNSVRLFDVAMGKEPKPSPGHTAPVNTVLFTPAGDLISASADKTAQVWNVADGKAKSKIDHGAPILSAALSKDGTRLATA